MHHSKLLVRYVVDTSVLVTSPEIFFELRSGIILIPIEVIEEIDHLKTRQDKVGGAARRVNRILDELRQEGDLLSGVRMDDGQVVQITTSSSIKSLPTGFEDTVDNRIISVAYRISKSGQKVVCLSNDLALRIKCSALKVEASEYHGEGFEHDLFDGLTTIHVDKFTIDELFEEGEVLIEDCDFMPNEGVLLRSEMSSGLGISDGGEHVRPLRIASKKGFNVQGISPRSKEQAVAFELLMDPEIHMVTMTGMAGCGKTLLAIASAVDQLMNKKYKKIVISRPVQSMSKDIGFLPGTKEEKMGPWVQPIFDNLEAIFSKKSRTYFQTMMDKGELEIEALSHVRGRSLPDTIFIIDEAQNITHHEAKAVLTRMGENSKIILIGDLEQIDSPKLNHNSSGLASVINLFKDFDRSGHVTLKKGERSELATHAAKIM